MEPGRNTGTWFRCAGAGAGARLKQELRRNLENAWVARGSDHAEVAAYIGSVLDHGQPCIDQTAGINKLRMIPNVESFET